MTDHSLNCCRGDQCSKMQCHVCSNGICPVIRHAQMVPGFDAGVQAQVTKTFPDASKVRAYNPGEIAGFTVVLLRLFLPSLLSKPVPHTICSNIHSQPTAICGGPCIKLHALPKGNAQRIEKHRQRKTHEPGAGLRGGSYTQPQRQSKSKPPFHLREIFYGWHH